MSVRYYSDRLRGMTIVEVIIVTSLFTLLMLIVTTGIQRLYVYNAYTFSQSYQVENARRGMQALIRDVREMTFADNGTFPLAVMEPHRIGFYSDIDRDNSVEYVEFGYTGSTTIEKDIYNATGSPPTYDTSVDADTTITLSRYVQNDLQATSTFYYYDENGTEVTNSANITDVRYVTSQIIVNIDPVRDPGQFMLRSSAALRNVKENL